MTARKKLKTNLKVMKRIQKERKSSLNHRKTKVRKGNKQRNRACLLTGGVGFLIRGGLQEVINVIHDAECKESIWLKLSLGGRDGSMYIGCIYLPIQGTYVNYVDECYENLSVDISRFKSKGRVVLLGDFNAHVGKGLDSDDVVGPFGEEVCNSNGTKLIELMQQSDLVLWNIREFCIEPQWTRIMPSLGQHSIVDYVASDRHLMSCSSFVHVDSTDIGSSDHLLL